MRTAPAPAGRAAETAHESQLLRAAALAASLDDRRGAGAPTVRTSPALVRDRLARWCQHAAAGDAAVFRAYLAEFGLSGQDAGRLMHGARVPAASEAPSWIHTLDDIVRRARSGGDAGDPATAPFGHLWTAAAGAAGEAVRRALPAGHHRLLGPGAASSLVAGLIADLGELAAPAAYVVFSDLRRRLREEGGAEAAYRMFVASEREAGLPLLVVRYPVLGRLVAQRVDELARAASELLGRLHDDLPALVAAFWAGADPGPVPSITVGWSDRHHGGRTVAQLVFEAGLVLAYKPRPVDAERSLHGLVPALEQAGLAAPLAPGVVAREGYGWAAWIPQRPCRGPAALSGYYRRAGTLLALSSVLQGTDLLVDNIIAAGPGPAVVDAEMLAPPRLAAPAVRAAGPPIAADAAVLAGLQDSVVDTGLLPWWVGASSGQTRDSSGLAGRHLAYGRCWINMNDAGMAPVTGPRPAQRARNAPTAGDVLADAAGQLEDLIGAYTGAHSWLGQHRAEAAGLVRRSGLFDSPARFTFRSTMAYELLALRASKPELLRNGLDRSLVLDAVNDPAWWPAKLARVHAQDPAAARAITTAERAALERLDIPLFMARPRERGLTTECGTVHGLFRGEPLADLDARLAGLDARHREEQLLCIRGCFEASQSPRRRGHVRQAGPGAQPGTREVSPGLLDAAARRIAELVAARAVRVEGIASWLVIGENHLLRRRQLMPIGPDLYGGRAGLGVFLAACARRWDDAVFARLAHECLHPIASFCGRAGPAPPGGALTGTASAVYGLALAAGLLDDRWLASGARRIAAGLAAAPAPGGQDTADAGDVADGLLGAALALAAAAGHGGGTAAADAAARLGTRALDMLLPRLLPAGPAPAGREPGAAGTGLAHGLMGAAFALSRIQSVTGDGRLAEAADAMLAAADTMLKGTGPAMAGDSWCRGTAGVAAAALALGEPCTTPSWQARVRAAVALAGRRDPVADASVCCGRGGAVELLLLAGQTAAARVAAAALIPPGGDDWAVGTQPGTAPLLLGFHRGLAGLGYTFLRAVSPTRFPSVLVWR